MTDKFAHIRMHLILFQAEGGMTAVFHYQFYLENQDAPFDATPDRSRGCRLTLSKDGESDFRMIPGLDVALKSMYKSELSEFIIRHDYAFGEAGSSMSCYFHVSVFLCQYEASNIHFKLTF